MCYYILETSAGKPQKAVKKKAVSSKKKSTGPELQDEAAMEEAKNVIPAKGSNESGKAGTNKKTKAVGKEPECAIGVSQVTPKKKGMNTPKALPCPGMFYTQHQHYFR